MSVYYQDGTITLHHGHALDVLAGLPAGSVDCCVTSPPYYGLRDYGVAGQIGAEKSPGEFVAALVGVFEQVRRVLADDGTCWLNLGDSYVGAANSGGLSPRRFDQRGTMSGETYRAMGLPTKTGAPPKNLLGMPWRVAFALQDAGWVLRNAIVWAKPNAMPESVTDRLSGRYELIFLLSKSRRYWFDLDPIREDYSERVLDRQQYAGRDIPPNDWSAGAGRRDIDSARGILGFGHKGMNPQGRNPGDVWTIPTTPFPGSHFAVFPPEIPRRAILAGCKPGGVVLDPFHGSGTTGMVAEQLGRRYIGVDINAEYLDLSLRTRLTTGALPWAIDE